MARGLRGGGCLGPALPQPRLRPSAPGPCRHKARAMRDSHRDRQRWPIGQRAADRVRAFADARGLG